MSTTAACLLLLLSFLSVCATVFIFVYSKDCSTENRLFKKTVPCSVGFAALIGLAGLAQSPQDLIFDNSYFVFAILTVATAHLIAAFYITWTILSLDIDLILRNDQQERQSTRAVAEHVDRGITASTRMLAVTAFTPPRIRSANDVSQR